MKLQKLHTIRVALPMKLPTIGEALRMKSPTFPSTFFAGFQALLYLS
jgi:hypothetical protein